MAALEAWQLAFDQAMQSHLEARAAAGDDYARLILALRVRPDDPRFAGDATAWAKAHAAAIREVAEALPDDPLVAWLEAQACGPGMGCDRLPALERMAALEPGNAASWLAMVDEALRLRDPDAVDRFLALAAGSDGFSTPGGGLARLYGEVLDGMAVPPMEEAVRVRLQGQLGLGEGLPDGTDATLLYAALLGGATDVAFAPALSNFSRLCGAPASPGRAASCTRSLERLARGDTLLVQGMGLSMLVDATQGSPQAAYWRERLRRHYWRQELVRRQGWFKDPGFIVLMAYDGEIAALEHYLRLGGFTGPPEGWLPRDPGKRGRVTGEGPLAG